MTDKNDSVRHGEWIEKCRKGDRQAQFEIYRLYYKAMYNICLRMVSRPAEAEDIMQEAFLSAFSRIGSFKGEVSFGAWLKRIVVNKSIDALRQQKIRFEEIPPEEPGEAQENAVDVESDDGESVETMVKQIKEAITKLPPGYQVVLSLALIEGYDHEEIAQILSVSESTSRSQLMRAKRKLTDIMKRKQK